MRRIFTLLFIVFTVSAKAQITNSGQPASWGLLSKSAINPVLLDKIDIEAVRKQDIANDALKAKPFRVGIPIGVNYGLDNSGVWTQLPNGDRIWRIFFESDNAIHLSVVFNDFYLPEGGTIYLYNDDRTDLVGAYTNIENNDDHKLGTWFVKGDKLWIEYYEPKDVTGQGRLNVSSVIHGYRLAGEYQTGYINDFQKLLNDSNDCQQDVDCPVGTDFESQRDLVKHSVAYLNMGDGYICSGALVNNTAQDKTPFFLSANHCYNRDNGTADASLFSMRFNWISPNPVCAEATNSTNDPTNFVMSGSTLRARSPLSDFMLVEINNDIPVEWNITYAGWDRSDNIPTFEVGIHHPSGDIMKISRDNDPAIKGQFTVNNETLNAWELVGLDGGTPTPEQFLKGGWEIGSTEGGSSGSPLFDQNGRIIGQLYGGWSECDGTNDNGGADLYGRFAISWSNGLKTWLDPLNTNPATLNSLQATLSVNDAYLNRNIRIYPNPSTDGIFYVDVSGLIDTLNYRVFNILGQELKTAKLSGQNETINLQHLENNIYFIKFSEEGSNRNLVKKIIINR
ncbi:MAG: T9SS type A sorting domain-containing protein [Flavobacteriaceae bacterium]|nr:T9SS type A sorting domain-containing protein [Flavobacteriaceae bacterium]